jgi:hypothetical protein
VKEIEKVAMNYADFCVSNAVNTVDGAAYDKFQGTLFESEMSRFYVKSLNQGVAEVQTEAPYPTYNNTNSTASSVVGSPTTNNVRKSSIFANTGSAKRSNSALLTKSLSQRIGSPSAKNRTYSMDSTKAESEDSDVQSSMLPSPSESPKLILQALQQLRENSTEAEVIDFDKISFLPTFIVFCLNFIFQF